MASNEILIVGAGFAGSVCAEQLARNGHRVVVVDKRHHIGGNAHDEHDQHGILIHPYGPHVFHTNSKKVFEYLSQFTSWRFYEHRVLAFVKNELYQIPINRNTLNKVFEKQLSTDDEASQFLDSIRTPREIKTSEDVALNSVGPVLTDMFFRGYTRKQWGRDLSELSPSVVSRIPTRVNTDDRYFSDEYQFMPADGYGTLFMNMLRNPFIEIRLGLDATDVMKKENWKFVIWTGPIDEYFGHVHGKLPYRSLRFEFQHTPFKNREWPVGTINFPDVNHTATRLTEFKHLTGQDRSGTSWCSEFPSAEGDPFYPVPTAESTELYKKYEEMALRVQSQMMFVGRLATYKYFNMDQVVAAALTVSQRIL